MSGAVLLILSQLMWAGATVIGKKLLVTTSPVLFTAVVLPLAGLLTLPLLVFYNFSRDIRPLITDNLGLVVVYTLLWLVIGELTFNAGLSKLSPVVATLLTFTLPLFTTLISVIFLGEKLSWQIIIGAVLIFSGVTVLTR